jgi:hypothetical protein
VGTLGKRFQPLRQVDVTQEPYFGLVKQAAIAWEVNGKSTGNQQD